MPQQASGVSPLYPPFRTPGTILTKAKHAKAGPYDIGTDGGMGQYVATVIKTIDVILAMSFP